MAASSSKITLNYELTGKDYAAFNARLYKLYKNTVEPIYSIIVIVLSFFILVVVDPLASSDTATTAFSISMTLLLTILISSSLLSLLTPFLANALTKSMVKRHLVDDLLGKVKLELLDNSIKDTTNKQRITEVSYDLVRSIESDKERLYIYTGQTTAYIIPFSAFKNDAQKQQFLDIVNNKSQKRQALQMQFKKNEAKKNKKMKLAVNIILITLFIFTLVTFILSIIAQPHKPDALYYMQNGILADPSYLGGAEQIDATIKQTSTEEDTHIELTIQQEQAEKIVKNNVLKECVDTSMKFGDFDYKCSDPTWEAPTNPDITYPTDDKDALCTRSWIDKSQSDHESSDESTAILCVNPKTSQLWYSYYAKSSAGWAD